MNASEWAQARSVVPWDDYFVRTSHGTWDDALRALDALVTGDLPRDALAIAWVSERNVWIVVQRQ